MQDNMHDKLAQMSTLTTPRDSHILWNAAPDTAEPEMGWLALTSQNVALKRKSALYPV